MASSAMQMKIWSPEQASYFQWLVAMILFSMAF
jgi:hypothetical protein